MNFEFFITKAEKLIGQKNYKELSSLAHGFIKTSFEVASPVPPAGAARSFKPLLWQEPEHKKHPFYVAEVLWVIADVLGSNKKYVADALSLTLSVQAGIPAGTDEEKLATEKIFCVINRLPTIKERIRSLTTRVHLENRDRISVRAQIMDKIDGMLQALPPAERGDQAQFVFEYALSVKDAELATRVYGLTPQAKGHPRPKKPSANADLVHPFVKKYAVTR